MTATAIASAQATHAATNAPGLLQLTLAQQQWFDTFGFLAFPGLIADRIDAVIAAFEAVWSDHGGGHEGARHDGRARSCLVPFIDQSAELSSLLDDPRIEGLASCLLGDDFNYLGSDGNYYVGDTAWHCDGDHPRQRFIKIAIYLDTLDGANGALRVIPGSQHPGDQFRKALSGIHSAQGFGVHGRDIPALALPVKPGDILVFNHNTWHASFGGGTRRRMFTLNLSQRYRDEDLPQLQEYLAGHARFLIDRNVGPKMLAGATPQRMRHLEQVMANDFLLTRRSAELRAQGATAARG